MATIIFDFDDTIFDTKKLKKDLFDKISCFGFSLDEIEKSYIKTLRENSGNFELDIFIKNLCIDSGPEKIKEELGVWFKNLNFQQYVFGGVENLLKEIRDKNHKIIMLTKGNEDFQNLKIENCGLKKYFDEINIVPGKKEDFMLNKNYSGEVHFLNDKESENKIIKENFPNINIIQINKKEDLNETLLFLE